MLHTFLTHFAADAACQSSSFFGLPTWYKYLYIIPGSDCTPQITNINDVWLIVAAVLEILLRISALLATGVVIWGGIIYIKSQGRPDDAAKARKTIIYAVVGLAVSVIATIMVTFAAGRFHSGGG